MANVLVAVAALELARRWVSRTWAVRRLRALASRQPNEDPTDLAKQLTKRTSAGLLVVPAAVVVPGWTLEIPLLVLAGLAWTVTVLLVSFRYVSPERWVPPRWLPRDTTDSSRAAAHFARDVLKRADGLAGAMPPSGQPPLPPPGGPSARRRHEARPDVDDRLMWALVALPLVGGIAIVILNRTIGAEGLPFFLSTGVALGLVVADLQANSAIEEGASTKRVGFVLAGAFFAPLYVWLRQRSVDRTRWPVAVHVGAILAAFALVFAATYVAIDGRILEEELENWAADIRGAQVVATCPDDELSRPGHRFICELDEGNRRVRVRVEVIDRTGSVRWDILNDV